MQIKEEIMIKAITSLPANFIFHMMSVSECGYHNAYGEKARKYHSAHDIEALQKRGIVVNRFRRPTLRCAFQFMCIHFRCF